MSRKKRESRGYTPALIEELDMSISGAALQLLLRIRRDSDLRETDGVLSRRYLDALAVAHGVTRAAKSKALAELKRVGLVQKVDGGFKDLHFDQWCRTSAERKDLREKWNAAKIKAPSGSTVESATDSAMESLPDSAHTASASVSESESVSESAAAAIGPAAASSEVSMPTQDASITVTKTWEGIVGREATLSEISHVAWVVDTYDRLTASQIADEMRRIATRPRQEPIHQIGYFDAILRELNDASKPTRRPSVVVRGEGEPPEDLSIPDWEAAITKRATA